MAAPSGTKIEVLHMTWGAPCIYPPQRADSTHLRFGLETKGDDPSLLARLKDEILVLKGMITIMEMHQHLAAFGTRARLWGELASTAAALWSEYLIIAVSELTVAPEINAAYGTLISISDEEAVQLPKELGNRLSDDVSEPSERLSCGSPWLATRWLGDNRRVQWGWGTARASPSIP